MRRRFVSRALPNYARVRAQQFRGKRLRGWAGSYGLTGTDVTLDLASGVLLAAGAGAFALTGQAAPLLRSARLAAASGSFALNGQDVTFARGKQLAAGGGTFAFSGQAQSLVSARVLSVAAGSFAVSGQSASLLKGKRLVADAGSFALTGQGAAFVRAYRIAAAAGAFAVTGQTATLKRARRLSAAAGSFALTGQAVTLTKTSQTVTFGDSATGTTSATIPVAQRVSGYICVCLAGGASTPGTPTGFTSLASNSGGANGARLSYKVLDGTETTISPSSASYTVLAIFQPSSAPSVSTGAAFNSQGTSGDPSSQSVPASGYGTPSIVLGAACSNNAVTGFSTASPAFAGEIDGDRVRLGYKIYNSGPADHSIDMNDFGTNVLMSGALVIS